MAQSWRPALPISTAFLLAGSRAILPTGCAAPMTHPNSDPPPARRLPRAGGVPSGADRARSGSRRRDLPLGNAAAQLSTLHLPPESLAFALDGAAQVVGAVRAGAALPAALVALAARVPAVAATPAARGAIQDLSYRAMRSLGRVDALCALLVRKAPPPYVGNLLCCALTLLLEAPPADDQRTAAAAQLARHADTPAREDPPDAAADLIASDSARFAVPVLSAAALMSGSPAHSPAYSPFTVVDQAVDAIAAWRRNSRSRRVSSMPCCAASCVRARPF